MQPEVKMLLCVSATSTPVERIFRGRNFMSPRVARLGQKHTSELLFFKMLLAFGMPKTFRNEVLL